MSLDPALAQDLKLPEDEKPVTLPGTIPGLLRVGSVVIWDEDQVVLVGNAHTGLRWRIGLCATTESVKTTDNNLDLDLSDPTSQAHAAWRVMAHDPEWEYGDEADADVLRAAVSGVGLSRKDQEWLRDMVLRLPAAPASGSAP